jgi:hypothetical protein
MIADTMWWLVCDFILLADLLADASTKEAVLIDPVLELVRFIIPVIA